MAERSPLYDVTKAAGAEMLDEAGWSMPHHYADPAAEYRNATEGAALFDVSHRGKIELTGKEAASFLHNLGTNDINNLPLGGGCEMFLTTSKAKVFSYVYVYHLRVRNDLPALWL